MIDLPCIKCAACEQPPLWEHTAVDGVFIKQMHLKDAGMLVPQHAHVYDHTSMLAHGRVRLWKDGIFQGDYSAPHPFLIKAKVKHAFQALEPDTVIYCIHNVSRTGAVEIHEEHQLSAASV